MPISGGYTISGQKVANLGEKELARIRNKEIGFIFRFVQLLPRLSALQNVELPMISILQASVAE